MAMIKASRMTLSAIAHPRVRQDTTKRAPTSSTDQGGGQRKATISSAAKARRATCDLLSDDFQLPAHGSPLGSK